MPGKSNHLLGEGWEMHLDAYGAPEGGENKEIRNEPENSGDI